ncbi:MAG: tellurite resistance/C4-dicarboxylate transporter family protein [Gemmatimonadota bacterium]
MPRLQEDAVLGRLQAAVPGLAPGYFALVMATGIVSTAVAIAGAPVLSTVLLIVAVVCYLVLAAGYGWRLVSYRREFLADAGDPGKAFSFFTFVAASDVLGTRLALGGQAWADGVLLAVAVAAWLVLSYVMPLGLITGHGAGSALAGVNGTWFLWTVGTQSLVVSLTAFPAPVAGYVTALAVMLWAVGVLLYLLIAGLVLAGLLHFPVDPARLTPAYWIFMGATAISVLAGARVLGLPAQPLLAAVRPVLAGLSVVLWAFGTWLVPLLIGLGIWRHLLRRVPLRYEPGLWSMVFPLGMHSVASWELGRALHVPWLTAAGSAGAWVAFAVWAAVSAAMLASLVSPARSR